jgi:peptidoglycan/LPS O-acetylase OafA/YrhL
MRRIVELDGIRAFAILMVIAHHYYPFTTMFYGLPEFGWAGVELFFVLSGFLITSILLQLKTKPNPYQIFYIRRILRIFPPYYLVLFLIVVIALIQHDHFSWGKIVGKAFFLQSFGKSPVVFAHIAHTIQGKLPFPNPFVRTSLPDAMHGFSVHGGFSKSFVPTWSLSVEEWFYILWAPLVLHFRRRALTVICITTCVVAFFIRWFGFLGFDTYFDFFSRIDVLMGGALLALWTERRRSLPAQVQRRWDSILLGASAVCWLLVAAILYSGRPILGKDIREDLLFMTLGLPLIVMGFSGALNHIIHNAGGNAPLNRFLRLKPFVAIGTISYTLYLIHVPVFFLVNEAAALFGVYPTNSYVAAVVIASASLLVSLCLAAISFRYFETPILKYKDLLTDHILGKKAVSGETDGTQSSGGQQVREAVVEVAGS